MKKRTVWLTGTAFAAVGTLALLASPRSTVAQTGHGKTTPWEAMAAAVGKVPGGKAHSATYMSEGGKWMYDVIVIKGKTITEVEVDAATGKAGDTETATPEQEGKEMAAELNKAIGKTPKKMDAKEEKEEKDEKPEKPGK